MKDDENIDNEYFISKSRSEARSDISELEFQNNEPPMYVLPLRNSVYERILNKSGHPLTISAFATRQNLSGTAIYDMLQLIQQHHLYCGSCKKLFDTQSEQCLTPRCTKNSVLSVPINMEARLQEMFQQDGVPETNEDSLQHYRKYF